MLVIEVVAIVEITEILVIVMVKEIAVEIPEIMVVIRKFWLWSKRWISG